MKQQDLLVIKIGGNVIDKSEKLRKFLVRFASIDQPKILVHGGGKIATQIGEKLGIQSKYVNGRRITDDAAIDLVTMVYGGLINKNITAQLQSLNCNAMGLTGIDANMVPAVKRPVKEIDFGWVGDVNPSKINVKIIDLLLQNGATPIFAPLTHDEDAHILNTNADTIASSLAVALSKKYKVKLIYCFEKKGILENIDDENSSIKIINKKIYKTLMEEKKLFEGIIPKIDNAFTAIDAGVKEIIIGDADDLLLNISDNHTGTKIV